MPYLIHVHDDGDVEVRQVEEEPLFQVVMILLMQDRSHNTDILLWTVEDVARELKEYGLEEDRIAELLEPAS